MRTRRYVGTGLALLLVVPVAGVPARAASGVQGTASVSHPVQYLADGVGKPFYATVTSTGPAVHGVVVNVPPGWTSVACPTAPAGWTKTRTATGCRFSSSSALRSGVFRVDARSASGARDLTGRWGVRLWSGKAFNGSTAVATSTGAGLVTVAHALEVTRAVVAPGDEDRTPGTACPDPARSAHPVGVTLWLCGINHSTARATLAAPGPTVLRGTFADADGEGLTSGAVRPGSASVVLGTFHQASMGDQISTGRYLDLTYGTRTGQTSPTTRLPHYTSTDLAPHAAANSASTAEGDDVQIVLTGTDGDGDDTGFATSGVSHGAVGAPSPPQCAGARPRTCTSQVTYTPAPGFTGSDSFTYTADDGFATSAAANVSISVS